MSVQSHMRQVLRLSMTSQCKRPLAKVTPSSCSLFMITTCLLAFYTLYGWAPFNGLKDKVRGSFNLVLLSCPAKLKEPIKGGGKGAEMKISWTQGGPRHSFWPEDPRCKDLVTKFAKVHTIQTRALVSYPGSGNTWIRYLVEGSTGLYTGSIFKDPSILKAGHFGEGRPYTDGSTILQKTHHRSLYIKPYIKHGAVWRKAHIASFGGRGVVVVRNPYKAILSYWNFFNTKSHTRAIKETSFNSSIFQTFVSTGAARWLELVEDWTSQGTDLHFIFYEQLIQDPVDEMRRLLKYLQLEVNKERLDCLNSHSAGSFKRVQHASKDPFTEDQHIMLRTVIRKAQSLIAEYGGGSLPVDQYQYYSQSS